MKSAVTSQDRPTIYIVIISISTQDHDGKSVKEKAFGYISHRGCTINPIMVSMGKTDMNWI
jgi:hypothetical protein